MSYPKDLDEYSNEAIEQEYQRRLKCQAENKCYYCGKNLDSGKPCKIDSHDGSGQE